MKKNILATSMLALAMTIGMKEPTRLKKAVEIHRNWKEDQPKEDRLSRLEKAKLKRVRKSNLKKVNLLKSRRGR